MTQVEKDQDGFIVDATLLAEAFKLKPDEVQALMHGGEITSRSETGVDEDAGQSRLTFHYRDRAVRFVIDDSGTILKRARFPARSLQSIPTDVAETTPQA